MKTANYFIFYLNKNVNNQPTRIKDFVVSFFLSIFAN